MPGDRGVRGGEIDPEVGVALSAHPAGRRRQRDEAVHGVGRLEGQPDPARPAERLAQLLQHLVGAVGRPHLPGVHLLPGRGRFAVR